MRRADSKYSQEMAFFIFTLHLAENGQRHPAADLRGYKPLLQFTIFSSIKSVSYFYLKMKDAQEITLFGLAMLMKIARRESMANVKEQICECLKIKKDSLNEIALEDIKFSEYAQNNINQEVNGMISIHDKNKLSIGRNTEMDYGIPCKGFWIEDSKDLVLYIWIDNHSKTIIVPSEAWMVRRDKIIH